MTISSHRLDFLALQHRKERYEIPGSAYNLPLDLRSFLFEYAGTFPECLDPFMEAWGELSGTLGRLEDWFIRLRGGEMETAFHEMVEAVITLLRRMCDILAAVKKQEPPELSGNHHAVAEWRDDLGALRKRVGEIFVCAARDAGVGNIDGAVTTLKEIKRLRLLRLTWET